MPNGKDFGPVFTALKSILEPYAPHLAVKVDQPGAYSLDAPYSEKYRRELFFGSAQVKKNYVSFYLMPVYMFPELLEGLPEGLRKRMQGKSCFNFKAVDEAGFADLMALAKKGFERFQAEGLV